MDLQQDDSHESTYRSHCHTHAEAYNEADRKVEELEKSFGISLDDKLPLTGFRAPDFTRDSPLQVYEKLSPAVRAYLRDGIRSFILRWNDCKIEAKMKAASHDLEFAVQKLPPAAKVSEDKFAELKKFVANCLRCRDTLEIILRKLEIADNRANRAKRYSRCCRCLRFLIYTLGYVCLFVGIIITRF